MSGVLCLGGDPLDKAATTLSPGSYCDSTQQRECREGGLMDGVADVLAAWQVVQVPITHPDAAALVEEVQQEYVARYGGRDETPLEPGYFDPPEGAFFVTCVSCAAPLATPIVYFAMSALVVILSFFGPISTMVLAT